MLPVPYFCYLFHIYVTRVCIPRLEAFMKAWSFPTDSKFVLSLYARLTGKCTCILQNWFHKLLVGRLQVLKQLEASEIS